MLSQVKIKIKQYGYYISICNVVPQIPHGGSIHLWSVARSPTALVKCVTAIVYAPLKCSQTLAMHC